MTPTLTALMVLRLVQLPELAPVLWLQMSPIVPKGRQLPNLRTQALSPQKVAGSLLNSTMPTR